MPAVPFLFAAALLAGAAARACDCDPAVKSLCEKAGTQGEFDFHVAHDGSLYAGTANPTRKTKTLAASDTDPCGAGDPLARTAVAAAAVPELLAKYCNETSDIECLQVHQVTAEPDLYVLSDDTGMGAASVRFALVPDSDLFAVLAFDVPTQCCGALGHIGVDTVNNFVVWVEPGADTLAFEWQSFKDMAEKGVLSSPYAADAAAALAPPCSALVALVALLVAATAVVV
mmetsp:Transcript_50770/g.124718  ORF Transcript_50770/g.124718 Transcript_50770/m.124718 type:complete len:229 (+) Transcript_50770:73-759(+)